ncbi:putative ribonuclease H-like domain-containing protein [Tanacetum coccineum]
MIHQKNQGKQAAENPLQEEGRILAYNTEDMQKRRNDVKARTTLLLALPDEHQLRFNKYDNAKELWEAILKTFGGNEATKKTKNNQLKQQYGNFKLKGQRYLSKPLIGYSNQSGFKIKYKDITQIDEDDIEEMDIKWNLALLSMRADRAPRSQDRGKRESYKKDPKVEEPAPKALIAIDGIGWDWSYMANEDENHALMADDVVPTEFAHMAMSSSSSSLDNELGKDFLMQNKACYKCGYFDHLASNCGIWVAKGETWPRGNYSQNNVKSPSTHKSMTPRAVLLKSGSKPIVGNIDDKSDVRMDYEPYDGGYVSFGHGGGKITGKGIIKTGKLNVLFTDSECLVLGKVFKLNDDTHVLLRTPRQHNMYSIDLNNIVPHKNLTCFIAKASVDESMLWHRRLGHLNFKTMNKLVRNNLVKGLPTKSFENDHTCVAYLKGICSKVLLLLQGWNTSTNISGTKEDVNQEQDGTADVSESSENTNPTASLKDSLADQVEPVLSPIVESEIPTVSSPVPTISTNVLDSESPELLASPTVENGRGSSYSESLSLGNVMGDFFRDITNSTSLTKVEADISNMETDIQEEGINYEEVFTPVARIKAIRLFLAYASYMGFTVYQMDVKSAFLYGTIDEEVYVMQPPGFEDPEFPNKVYRVEKAMYGLHQAPRAWYGTMSKYLLANGFQRGTIDQTLFIRKHKGEFLLVQVYVDDIIFGSSNLKLCREFEALMHDKFKMSPIGELTFFIGLQVFLGRMVDLLGMQKLTIMATTTTEAEYKAAASGCGQVLWIQN